jgi:hypothetical protein
MNASDTQSDIVPIVSCERQSMFSRMAPWATTMIRLDHTHVLATFHRYRPNIPASRKAGLAGVICTALEIHATLEEEIFYPALHAAADIEVMQKSVPEHMEMRRLIADLRALAPDDPRFDDTLLELMRDVIHHVADEETVLLPQAELLFSASRLQELGSRMTRRRMQLAGPRMPRIAYDMARGMPVATFALGAVAIMGMALALRPGRR